MSPPQTQNDQSVPMKSSHGFLCVIATGVVLAAFGVGLLIGNQVWGHRYIFRNSGDHTVVISQDTGRVYALNSIRTVFLGDIKRLDANKSLKPGDRIEHRPQK